MPLIPRSVLIPRSLLLLLSPLISLSPCLFHRLPVSWLSPLLIQLKLKVGGTFLSVLLFFLLFKSIKLFSLLSLSLSFSISLLSRLAPRVHFSASSSSSSFSSSLVTLKGWQQPPSLAFSSHSFFPSAFHPIFLSELPTLNANCFWRRTGSLVH